MQGKEAICCTTYVSTQARAQAASSGVRGRRAGSRCADVLAGRGACAAGRSGGREQRRDASEARLFFFRKKSGKFASRSFPTEDPPRDTECSFLIAR